MRHIDARTTKYSIETILNLIGLTNDRQTLTKNLSGGMKRRLSIGISLIGDPKVCPSIDHLLCTTNSQNIFFQVLILDEPTSGIGRLYR